MHRALRPEEFGGLVHFTKTGAADYPLHPDILNSQAVAEVFARTGAYLLPQAYPGLVEIRAPEQIAATLLAMLGRDAGEELRDIFTRHFTLERHLAALADALRSAEAT